MWWCNVRKLFLIWVWYFLVGGKSSVGLIPRRLYISFVTKTWFLLPLVGEFACILFFGGVFPIDVYVTIISFRGFSIRSLARSKRSISHCVGPVALQRHGEVANMPRSRA